MTSTADLLVGAVADDAEWVTTTIDMRTAGHVGSLCETPFTTWVSCSCGDRSTHGSRQASEQWFVDHCDGFGPTPDAALRAWSAIVAERRRELAALRRPAPEGRRRPEPGHLVLMASLESLARADRHVVRCHVCGAQCWDGICWTPHLTVTPDTAVKAVTQ